MKFANCGAPLGNTDEVCAYCGTVTPYGEKLRAELSRKAMEEEIRIRQKESARRRRIVEKISTVRKPPIVIMIVLYIITFGYYSPYWYCRRSGFICGCHYAIP